MDSHQQIIYLDNNATTPIDSHVLESMMPFLTDNFANANSTHKFGIGAFEAVKKARVQVSEMIGAETNEVVFTSGSTEAINIAIKGVAENYKSRGNHIVTVSSEHPAVLDTCRHLETIGYRVSYLSVDANGLIDLKELRKLLSGDTILVSVMMANNETGVIQPIKEISELTHSVGALFMTDATQAIGKLPVNIDDLGIDLLALSAHKFYGPKGIGALFVRQHFNRVKLPTFIHGGGHEKGLRSGTLNVPAIVGLGSACNLAKLEMRRNTETISRLRDYLEGELLKLDNTSVNGSVENRLYNTTNILFKGADSDAVILGLSQSDQNLPLIAVSNGSACTSTSIEPSHVLTAMGMSELDAFSSIRFSLNKYNTKDEIDIVIKLVKEVVINLRALVN